MVLLLAMAKSVGYLGHVNYWLTMARMVVVIVEVVMVDSGKRNGEWKEMAWGDGGSYGGVSSGAGGVGLVRNWC